jgi:branched-chain amino acid transport system substrate-binding protein
MDPLVDDVFRFIGKNPDRRRRMLGMTTASNTPTNARLVQHFNDVFRTEVTRTLSPNTAYDAFFVLAYAAYALGDQPVTGASLARAIPRLLPPGKPIEVGPSAIFDGYNALRAGGNIDLVGSTGSLDFDPQTGEAPTDEVILCGNADDQGRTTEAIESGLVYDATAKKLKGEMRCP